MTPGAAGPDTFFELLYAAMLTLPRLLAALTVLPFLSPKLIGGSIRASLALVLATLVIPLTFRDMAGAQLTIGQALLLLPKEILIGMVLGFLTAVPFWIAAGLGRLIDLQRGALTATLLTPLFRDPISPIAVLLTQAAAVLFLSGAGLMLFLEALYRSYTVWPVASWAPGWHTGAEQLLIAQFQILLYWVVVLGAPALILVFLVDLLMGILNRFVPELNVFFLAFPFKGVVCMFVLAVYAGVIMETLNREFMARPDWLSTLFLVLE